MPAPAPARRQPARGSARAGTVGASAPRDAPVPTALGTVGTDEAPGGDPGAPVQETVSSCTMPSMAWGKPWGSAPVASISSIASGVAPTGRKHTTM